MKFLIVFLFVLSGSLRAYSVIAFSSGLPDHLTEQQTEQLEQAQKSVWRIGHRISHGTDFFVSPRHVVTNWHALKIGALVWPPCHYRGRRVSENCL